MSCNLEVLAVIHKAQRLTKSWKRRSSLGNFDTDAQPPRHLDCYNAMYVSVLALNEF